MTEILFVKCRLGLEAKKEENLSDWFSQVREFCTVASHFINKVVLFHHG